ncbi:MAG TPA: response regulator [Thermoanaerobaculia bacterium]|nr:response regulator [Thermoanaerobaculia bacterium]
MTGGGRETVYLVDDEPAVLKSLSRLLRSEGFTVAAFGSPAELLEQLDPAARGCFVLDLAMPGLDGLALQNALSARGSELPILFLTGRGDIQKSVAAMKSGAMDFLTKPVDDERLFEAVRAALEKDRARRRARAEVAEIGRRLATLTPREREVLEGVVTGRLNKQIAASLEIALKTVKIHRGRMMEKMGAKSVAELVLLADRAGLRR